MLFDLVQAIIGHTAPARHAWQSGLTAGTTTGLRICFGNRDLMACPQQCPRTFKTRRPSPDNQMMLRLRVGGNGFWMPFIAPLFRHSRILRTPDGQAISIHRHADVTANTFADFLNPSVPNFSGQKWVRNRWTRRPNQIQATAFNQRHHQIWRSETANPDDWLAGHRFYKISKR